ncbi:MAG: hypothetical protein EOO88_39300, partial [Pedobacter sp.]
MLKAKILIAILLLVSVRITLAQQTVPLYSGSIPNSKDVTDEETTEKHNGVGIISKISHPTITYFAPKGKPTGQSIIIFPGGSYWVNAIDHEGLDVGKRFSEWGVAAFVVKYRIPDNRTMIDPAIGPLQDAQQAMLFVRSNATKYGLSPNKIGIMGFSAGGHLASTLGTHYQKPLIDNPGNISLRPDFMLLIYPVISSDTTISHRGSFEKLLGPQPSATQFLLYSNEKQVTHDTPPTFLLHATDDDVVPVENVLVFYDALKRNKVPAELHIYPTGGHGFGMHNPHTDDQWPERAKNWMAKLDAVVNPLLPAGADPFSFYRNGYYYYTNSTGNNITVWKTRTIGGLATAEKKVVFTPPAKGPYSKELWAPEIHHLRGKWYVYFAADSGNNKDHRMFVLENDSEDPMQGEWKMKGKLKTPDDKWAIDGSVFEYQNKLYFLWSGWEGNVNGQQNIYIAAMKDPWTITGKRTRISAPELAWEKHGDLNNPDDVPHVNVNEGPEILIHDDQLFLIYSASGCWTNYYALGMLTAKKGGNLLSASTWVKSPEPVFKMSERNKVYA